MTNDIEQLEDIIPNYSSEVYDQFRAYFSLIEQFNLRINLIAKGTVHRAVTKHFADSCLGLEIIRKQLIEGQPIFDFGSGNGFPGIIAGILFPDYPVVLVERDTRKAEFLKTASHKLNLRNMEVFSGSTTNIAEGRCHNVISRAMAPLPKFLLENRPILGKGGSAFLFKGDHWSTEFSTVPPQVFEFWDVELLDAYDLSINDGRRFIIQCRRI